MVIVVILVVMNQRVTKFVMGGLDCVEPNTFRGCVVFGFVPGKTPGGVGNIGPSLNDTDRTVIPMDGVSGLVVSCGEQDMEVLVAE